MARTTERMTGRLRRCAALMSVGTLATLAACGPGSDDSQSAPHDIVVNLAGEVVSLDDLNARPHVTGPRPAGAEDADAYRLAGPRELASGEVVGIRDDGVVAIEPRKPDRAVLLGPAAAWFPSVDRKQLWAVTEEPAATACAGKELPTTVSARFTVTRYEPSGRPSHETFSLPCGLRPVADTSEGLLALRTTGDAGGTATGAREVTDIVLLNAKADATAKTVATNASVIAAAGQSVIWRDDTCDKGPCTHRYNLEKGKSTGVPSCKSGDPVGVGTLDASGRWYASALRTNRLALLDLHEGTCRELDALPAAGAGDLEQTYSLTWSGSNLLLLDQRSGTLSYVDAPAAKVVKRTEPLPVVNEGQIWSAAGN